MHLDSERASCQLKSLYGHQLVYNTIFTSEWVFVTSVISYAHILLAVIRHKASFAKRAALLKSTPPALAAAEPEFIKCKMYSAIKAVFHGTSSGYTKIIEA